MGLAGVKLREWNSLVEQVVSSGRSSVVDKNRLERGKVLKTSAFAKAVSESGLERLSTGIDDWTLFWAAVFWLAAVVLVAGQRNWEKYAFSAVAAHILQIKIGVICKW